MGKIGGALEAGPVSSLQTVLAVLDSNAPAATKGRQRTQDFAVNRRVSSDRYAARGGIFEEDPAAEAEADVEVDASCEDKNARAVGPTGDPGRDVTYVGHVLAGQVSPDVRSLIAALVPFRHVNAMDPAPRA